LSHFYLRALLDRRGWPYGFRRVDLRDFDFDRPSLGKDQLSRMDGTMTRMFYSFGNFMMLIEQFLEYKRDYDETSQLFLAAPSRQPFVGASKHVSCGD
jgi:hypothetical protein